MTSGGFFLRNEAERRVELTTTHLPFLLIYRMSWDVPPCPLYTLMARRCWDTFILLQARVQLLQFIFPRFRISSWCLATSINEPMLGRSNSPSPWCSCLYRQSYHCLPKILIVTSPVYFRITRVKVLHTLHSVSLCVRTWFLLLWMFNFQKCLMCMRAAVTGLGHIATNVNVERVDWPQGKAEVKKNSYGRVVNAVTYEMK
jgi:hypothetical protein